MIGSQRFFIIGCILLVVTSLFSGCFPGGDVGPRPAANPVTVVEAYLQQYQPGPLPRLFQTTSLYDRNGVLLAEVYPEGRRTWVSLGGVSPHLINATIATEDASFYQNIGIDPRRIAGALWQNTGSQEVVSGASTITMQLARNLFMGYEQRHDQTLDRKLQEAGIAQELTNLYSKDEILEMYLNLLNYSSLNYGPEAAARFYFGKPARDLTLAGGQRHGSQPGAPFYAICAGYTG
jgi:membrane peptidoglycan carboxypeptidase